MKAKPVKLVYGEGFIDCVKDEATHITLNNQGQLVASHCP